MVLNLLLFFLALPPPLPLIYFYSVGLEWCDGEGAITVRTAAMALGGDAGDWARARVPPARRTGPPPGPDQAQMLDLENEKQPVLTSLGFQPASFSSPVSHPPGVPVESTSSDLPAQEGGHVKQLALVLGSAA